MSKFCMGCMEQYEDEYNVCPYCGFIEGTRSAHAFHMEPGSILAERYIVGRALGFGGFGVTYIGWDALLEQKVAIKEYLPGEFSTRMPGVTQITVYNGDKREQFRDGLRQFVNEAKRLAKLNSIEGIVKVYGAFEENSTAYIVMEYLEGETLAARLKREETIPVDEAVAMMLPVIDALQEVHEHGVLHRDLAPDNLFIQKDGTIKVIDFGAARHATTSHSRSLTVIIKPGYSAEEQYRSRADQGTYTDVYSIGATLYRMITGVTPPDALERRAMLEASQKDKLSAPSKYCKQITKNQEHAILNATHVRAEDRTKTMAQLAEQLRSEKPVPLVAGKIRKTATDRWPLWIKLVAGLSATAVAVFAGLFWTGVIGPKTDLQTGIEMPETMTRVPSVISNTTDEADQRMTAAGLLYTITGKEYSSLVPADYVLTQDVNGGTVVTKNTNINLTISGGPEQTLMPDVLLIPGEEAIRQLEEAGFVVEIEEAFSSVVEAGYVVSQSVESSTEVAMGSQILLVISMGVDPELEVDGKPIQVPDLSGKLYDEIMALAEKEGFRISVSGKENSEDHPVNTVISQNPAAGTEIASGETISVVISLGAEKIRVPDVQFKSGDEAAALLKAQSLKVKKTEEYSESVAAGLVIRQEPAAGTMLDPGAEVTLVISKGSAPFKMPDVRGMTEQAARSTLESKGITVHVQYEYSRSGSGTVLAQSIAPDKSVSRGTSVTLTVSIGEETIQVPDVVGKDSETAKSTLESRGFVVTINWVYDNVDYGRIISQSLTPGASYKKGTTIVLNASLGKDTVQSISVIRQPNKRDYYQGERLDTSGLTLKATYKSGKTSEITRGFSCDPATLNTVGTQTITVTYEGASTSFTVNVTAGKPDSIRVTASSDVLELGGSGTCTVTAQVSPQGGSISWSSSNRSVATVSGSGTTATVTAVGEGSTTITATYTLNGVSISDSCTITVRRAGSTLKMVINGYPSRGSLDSFYIDGYISSNYELDRFECWGSAKCNALFGLSLEAECSTYYFSAGTYEESLAGAIRDHVVNQYYTLYNKYVEIADTIGVDNSLDMTVTLAVYDKSGASQQITISYVLDEDY